MCSSMVCSVLLGALHSKSAQQERGERCWRWGWSPTALLLLWDMSSLLCQQDGSSFTACLLSCLSLFYWHTCAAYYSSSFFTFLCVCLSVPSSAVTVLKHLITGRQWVCLCTPGLLKITPKALFKSLGLMCCMVMGKDWAIFSMILMKNEGMFLFSILSNIRLGGSWIAHSLKPWSLSSFWDCSRVPCVPRPLRLGCAHFFSVWVAALFPCCSPGWGWLLEEGVKGNYYNCKLDSSGDCATIIWNMLPQW